MILISKNLANEILNLIRNKITIAQIITDQGVRDVYIVNKEIIDDQNNNELSLKIELYRAEEITETLTEINFFDSLNNPVFKTTNLEISLPATKVSFVYQIRLVYSQ